MENNYFYKKEIDWSTLNQGISIPATLQFEVYNNIKQKLQRGESKKVTIIIEGDRFNVELKNQLFDQKKYPEHKDVLQIRYLPSSDIVKTLRRVFNNSWEYFIEEKNKPENFKHQIKTPEDKREYIALYTSDIPDVFVAECLTISEIEELKYEAKDYEELSFERSMNRKDEGSSIYERTQVAKIRKMDNSIGKSLKELYNYRCQVCGENFGKLYDAHIVEAHHIEFFSQTMNNNTDNIVIMCPNHHSVIHKVIPRFNRGALVFEYGNGYKEKLKLNMHL